MANEMSTPLTLTRTRDRESTALDHERDLGWVPRYYGRKEGLVRDYYARFLYRCGSYRHYTTIDWSTASRLIFVCTGNISRSPYAEARARLHGLSAISFGVAARGGDRADPVATRIASERGVELSSHRSRGYQDVGIQEGDLILAMEPWQLQRVALLCPQASLTLLGLWSSPTRPHIEDPFGLCAAYHHTCFQVIDSAIERITNLTRS